MLASCSIDCFSDMPDDADLLDKFSEGLATACTHASINAVTNVESSTAINPSPVAGYSLPSESVTFHDIKNSSPNFLNASWFVSLLSVS